MAELLVNAGADLNIQDEAGYTPLNTAVLRGVMNNGNNLCKTILDPNIFLGSPRIAEMLIEKGADLNIKTGYGYTPLFWAVHKGRTFVGRTEKNRKFACSSVRPFSNSNQCPNETRNISFDCLS